MFDAQKILGALISDGVESGGFHSSRRRMSNDSQGLLGDLPGGSAGKMLIGAAGVAAAGGLAYMAYQHFKQPGAPGVPGAAAAPQGGPGFFDNLFGSSSPAQPPAMSAAQPYGASNYGVPTYHNDPSSWGAPLAPAGSAPAVPSYAAPAVPAAPAPSFPAQAGPPAGPSTSDDYADALLLVRAMVTAANMDGQIDQNERARILERLAKSGLGAAEQQALARELDAPQPPYALLGQIRSREVAKQFYAVSLLAAGTDSDTEKAYIKGLPPTLGLKPEDVAELHQLLGIAPIV